VCSSVTLLLLCAHQSHFTNHWVGISILQLCADQSHYCCCVLISRILQIIEWVLSILQLCAHQSRYFAVCSSVTFYESLSGYYLSYNYVLIRHITVAVCSSVAFYKSLSGILSIFLCHHYESWGSVSPNRKTFAFPILEDYKFVDWKSSH